MERIKDILVIEDDFISTFIAVQALKKLNMGIKSMTAKNGLEALYSITNYNPKENLCPEIIILDLHMPVMDGFEFLDNFNKMDFANKKEVTIIVASESLDTKVKNILIPLGVKHFIEKPLLSFQLMKILETLTDKYRIIQFFKRIMPRMNNPSFGL